MVPFCYQYNILLIKVGRRIIDPMKAKNSFRTYVCIVEPRIYLLDLLKDK